MRSKESIVALQSIGNVGEVHVVHNARAYAYWGKREFAFMIVIIIRDRRALEILTVDPEEIKPKLVALTRLVLRNFHAFHDIEVLLII